MVVMKTKKSKKTKAVTTQPYYVNIDTRIILEVCLVINFFYLETSSMLNVKSLSIKDWNNFTRKEKMGGS
jgi:hypothetical protein